MLSMLTWNLKPWLYCQKNWLRWFKSGLTPHICSERDCQQLMYTLYSHFCLNRALVNVVTADCWSLIKAQKERKVFSHHQSICLTYTSCQIQQCVGVFEQTSSQGRWFSCLGIELVRECLYHLHLVLIRNLLAPCTCVQVCLCSLCLALKRICPGLPRGAHPSPHLCGLRCCVRRPQSLQIRTAFLFLHCTNFTDTASLS